MNKTSVGVLVDQRTHEPVTKQIAKIAGLPINMMWSTECTDEQLTILDKNDWTYIFEDNDDDEEFIYEEPEWLSDQRACNAVSTWGLSGNINPRTGKEY